MCKKRVTTPIYACLQDSKENGAKSTENAPKMKEMHKQPEFGRSPAKFGRISGAPMSIDPTLHWDPSTASDSRELFERIRWSVRVREFCRDQ